MPVAPPVTTATLPRSSPSLIPADVQVDAVARLRLDRHLPRAPQTLHARTIEGGDERLEILGDERERHHALGPADLVGRYDQDRAPPDAQHRARAVGRGAIQIVPSDE